MVARLLLHLTGADHTVLQTLGQRLGSTFVYDHHYGRGRLLTNFQSVPDFQECSEDERDG